MDSAEHFLTFRYIFPDEDEPRLEIEVRKDETVIVYDLSAMLLRIEELEEALRAHETSSEHHEHRG